MNAEWFVKRLCEAARGLPVAGALLAAVWLAFPGAPASAADSFSTDWAEAAKSQARLIAGGANLAGFEIALKPGAITYWRDPGDAGLPPTLDFSTSDNVASVEVEFPAPKRMHEADGGEAFGYDSDVVFPLAVKLRDPTKPATLKLNADFAVCEKVCLPAKAHLELTLPTSATLPTRARSTPPSRPCRAPSRRRISARSRRSTRIAGGSAQPAKTGPRATSSSRRRKAGG